MLKKTKFRPRPQVTISLEPILEAYCRFKLNTPPDQKEIAINLKSDIGLLIHAHVQSSHFARKGPLIINPVTIILPTNPQNQNGVLSGFLFIDNWGLQKIENGIKYDFRKWVERRYETGYKKRWDRKDIIEAILRGLNVRNNVANFDAIKKIDYRNHRKTEEIRFAELLLSDT